MSWECTCSVNSLCRKDVIDTDFSSLGDFICHFVGCSIVKQHSERKVSKERPSVFVILVYIHYIP